MCGELIAEKYKIARKDCDEYSLMSHKSSYSAQTNGYFNEEIIPITSDIKGMTKTIDADEGIRTDTTMEKLASLPSTFKENGVLTAGNSSQISDGSAAVVLMSSDYAADNSITPLCHIVDYSITGVVPTDLMEAPILGTRHLLAKCDLSIDDIDLIEYNEAFSSGSIAFKRALDINSNKMNIHGGAIALGHPIGASGTRIFVTLIHALRKYRKKRGLATLCAGGGHAVSLIVER